MRRDVSYLPSKGMEKRARIGEIGYASEKTSLIGADLVAIPRAFWKLKNSVNS